MNYFDIAFPYVLAFSITLGMIWILAPVARHIGLVDHPNARKHHSGRVPLVGGVAMFCGFAFGVLALGLALNPQRAVLAGTLVMVIAGILDDFRELSAQSRFIAQIAAGALLVFWGDVVLRDLGRLLIPGDYLGLSWFAVPLTVFAVVGGVNAFNMVDGLDGLAGGLALIVLGPLAWLMAESGPSDLLAFAGIIGSCVLAFWLVNMRFPWQRKARVFMGDSGSMFVGFLLCWLLADASQAPGRVITPVTALYLFAIPLLDTIFVMTRRIRNGLSPLGADRRHLHFLLMDLGLSPGPATVTILLMAALIAATGVGGMITGTPEYVMFYGFLVLSVLYYVTCSRLRFRVRHVKRTDPGLSTNENDYEEP